MVSPAPQWIRLIDRELRRALPAASTRPVKLHEAMRYSVFAGGKRLRPIVCLMAAEASGGDYQGAIPLACAIECIHTYSLIHDDLPCMDDDDFRRGKPTCHKVFGEAVAVLAGDALLTLAFELATEAQPKPRYPVRAMVRELAVAAGSRWLVGGQAADLDAERKTVSRQALRYIHESKTAALLTASIRLGAMSANATPTHLEALTHFGKNLGLAFQIVDDILDVTQTTETLGKSAGKDAASGKATYPAVWGMKAAEREAARHTQLAMEALRPLSRRGEPLLAMASALLDRNH